jgi:hypothetical protein
MGAFQAPQSQKTNERASNVIWPLIRFGTHHMDSTWLVSQETWPCFKNLKHFHTTCVDLFPTSPKMFNLKHVWSFKLYFGPWSFIGRCAKWEFVFGVPKFLPLNPKHFYLFEIIVWHMSLALLVFRISIWFDSLSRLWINLEKTSTQHY